MKWLLLVRHLESAKNVRDSFAQSADEDHLTETGRSEAALVGANIAEFLAFLRVTRVRVYCSPAPRTNESVSGLCSRLGVQARELEGLRSIVVPETAGLSLSELRLIDPEAARELNLYRAGLFDTYAMKHVGPLARQLERRVNDALLEILSAPAEAAVVVAHRSALTAALLGIAREAGYYPKEFFGFLPIDFGASALIRVSDRNVSDIVFANLPTASMNTWGRELALTVGLD
ncbi:histidine phosphatase family protein [Micromonospora sp. D93]|uniref:histidine phosphatase family protein n=1 Tax=Micromonospora sp. D93 TaxID=2824886 RepID=UPI001B36071B|nr:histidine phosphatase family protein [Micromonospora sp. D93]MBQ1017934.1 histidine phosphatase family protein [Micromonospora sp. D93]